METENMFLNLIFDMGSFFSGETTDQSAKAKHCEVHLMLNCTRLGLGLGVLARRSTFFFLKK